MKKYKTTRAYLRAMKREEKKWRKLTRGLTTLATMPQPVQTDYDKNYRKEH